MASIFTYQDEPPRIHSPWSTPGTTTPQIGLVQEASGVDSPVSTHGLTRLEPERQDGPTEYKLHLLLRPRRKFLSTSTATPTSISTATASGSDGALERHLGPPSSQARQSRLHQLTTQLLWRLQQSSPFHSSSNASLVLPLLPEATPRLGSPDRPARLLPGLEESQGALYEIGVGDDGTLVGLVEDELQESLTNLNAMAASLGCLTTVLRKTVVGTGEWEEVAAATGPVTAAADAPSLRKDRLWVAEVLVYPDSRQVGDLARPVPGLPRRPDCHEAADADGPLDTVAATTDQLRVTLVGATLAGKSSLLGTLSTSTMDNGRGKSRLSLLKHRHEMASGVTSSVAQELVGYVHEPGHAHRVVNYASGNVSSWIDMHHLADRLVFLSDSPGVPRYAKSTFRSLMSWRPSWIVFCVAADHDDDHLARVGAAGPPADSGAAPSPTDPVDLAPTYLDLCLRLRLPLLVVITKMDRANKPGLRKVLTKLLSRLKSAGRKPLILNQTATPPAPAPADAGAGPFGPPSQRATEHERQEIRRAVASLEAAADDHDVVPILMASAVTGMGMRQLHLFLDSLPLRRSLPTEPEGIAPSPLFYVDEVFSIPPSRVFHHDHARQPPTTGVVLCGTVARGVVSIGMTLSLGPFVVEASPSPSLPSTPKPRSWSAEKPAREMGTHAAPRSYQGDHGKGLRGPPVAEFMPVRIVSLRNLRLPVVHMGAGDTGTIGVELVNDVHDAVSLSKARKGMVLTDPRPPICAHGTFAAAFPSSDFSRPDLPPLILGGHATVYVNSIRAAVKVQGVTIDDDRPGFGHHASPRSPDVDFFHFDSDPEAESAAGGVDTDDRDVRVSFSFVNSVEWMERGDQIIVVPTVAAPGPVAGTATSNVSGLSGFVGHVCDLFS